MRDLVCIGSCVLLLACGDPGGVAGASASSSGMSEAASTSSTSSTSTSSTASSSGELPTTGGAPTSSAGGSADATGSDPDTSTGEAEADPWVERRGVLHVHSPYSHDACDGEGLMNGAPNPGCLADLRAAICDGGLDFALLTDHPAHMQEYPFTDVLLYSEAAGDELVMMQDMAWNHMRCADDRRVVLGAGYESHHTLPLGLHHHVDAALYAGLTDATPLADAKALIAGLAAGGAVTAIAHSEESDLSAARIVEVGLDAMEWYNPHGNFKNALGGDNIAGDPGKVLDTIQGLQPFMVGSQSGAHPDLVYLRLLPSWPVEGFNKWREVQRVTAITGLLGSDVHQNVRVAPICDQDNPVLQAACIAAAEAALPEALAGLVAGGTLTMSDGDRLDSFARVLRWLENSVLTEPGPLDLEQLQAALRAGRSYGLFTVFGAPEQLRFAGRTADDTLLWIGDAAVGPVELQLRAPLRPLALGGAPFTTAQADTAELRTELWRTDAGGSVKVADATGLGATIDYMASDPGAYHVEVYVRPQHLREALGSEDELADIEYMWVITNPIRVLR
ncbi:MAG TPA: hypothetical protein VGB85_15390 [Nannocystis sp.]